MCKTSIQSGKYKIGSDVKVDGLPVANLDVRLSLISGSLDYKLVMQTHMRQLLEQTQFDLQKSEVVDWILEILYKSVWICLLFIN
jgi:hypothetical protein